MLACYLVSKFHPVRELLIAGSFLALGFLFLAIFGAVSYFLGVAVSRGTRASRYSGAYAPTHHVVWHAHK
jgi:hypothetical protein